MLENNYSPISDSEVWVQALYGNQWEDIDTCLNLEHAKGLVQTLKTERSTGSFRVIERLIIEKELLYA